MNKQDLDGKTPLHLAVAGVDDAEVTRFVKLLTMRGAALDIKDNDGNIPIDLVD